MENIFAGILLVFSVVIIIAVLMMEPKTQGMGSLTGGETNVFGQGNKRGKDAILDKVVIGSSVIFLVSAVILAAL